MTRIEALKHFDPYISQCVCVFVSLLPEEAWTFKYLLDTYDLQIPFGQFVLSGTYQIPSTFWYFWILKTSVYPLNTLNFKYLIDTLGLQVPLGPLGTFWTYLLELTRTHGIDMDSWY